MGFTQTKFLGATVVGFAASVGWNEQVSTLTVDLAEDPAAGDSFAPPAAGTVASFAMGGFAFEGIVQTPRRVEDFQACPGYRVVLNDPRELLAGVMVLVDSYRGRTDMVPNLINAFGYWEDRLGFGGALANESGMLWEAPYDLLNISPGGGIELTEVATVGIKSAIAAITGGAGGPYGGPVSFRGQSLPVDLSGLPPAPPTYRIGGTARSLLELVGELCGDAGHDFLVYLRGGVVRFRTVSRTAQPQPGQVAAYVQSRPDATARSYGTELRNEPTNAVLLGGSIHDLSQVTNPSGDITIWPYWGEYEDGTVVVGTGTPEVAHEAILDASPVAEVVGGTRYRVTLPELRCALVDYDSWAAYVMRNEPDKAAAMDLAGTVDSTSDLQELFPDVLFRRDLVAERERDLVALGGVNESDYWSSRIEQVYNFVRTYATEFYGRKFLVRLPRLIYAKFVPETGQLVRSDEISQDGGWLPEGSRPLGLGYDDLNAFTAEDGRYLPFVAFAFDPTMDLDGLPPEDYAVENDTLYLRASVDDKIVQVPGQTLPYCVVTLPAAVYRRPETPLGNLDDLAAILGVTPAMIATAAGLRAGSFPVRVHPPAFRPVAAAVPLRSNRDSYGPWGTFGDAPSGAAGKVVFERDESLVPWLYGDMATLDAAARARLAGVATQMQEAEVGDVEVAGLPEISLGDVLVSGGPNVTGIEAQVSTSGVTTAYRMQTYTPQFGAFQRSNAERLRRLGVAAQQARRSLRALYARQRARQRDAFRARVGMMENAAHAVRQRTPHDVLMGQFWQSERYGYRTQACTATVDEFLANCRADVPDYYAATAGMGLEGLVRPIDGDFDSTRPMPCLQRQNDQLPAGVVTTESLDVWRDSDVDILLSGTEYPGTVHRLKGQLDYDRPRFLGLRGPLFLVGYGHETTGKPVPNQTSDVQPIETWSDDFVDDHKKRPDLWKAGVVDLRWDTWRGVWATPTYLEGTLDGPLTCDDTSSALMTIKVGTETLFDKVRVYGYFGGSLPAGSKVGVNFYPHENRWKVTAASCGTAVDD